MIRPLGPQDLATFMAIRAESFREAPLAFGQAADAKIDPEQTLQDLAAKNESNFILGYFVDEQLVGMMGLMRYELPKRRHRSYLWGVYVAQRFQGRGIARQLLDECILRARKLDGLERIILTVSHHATGAIALYTKAGFVTFGREPGAARTGDIPMDEIYMLLDL